MEAGEPDHRFRIERAEQRLFRLDDRHDVDRSLPQSRPDDVVGEPRRGDDGGEPLLVFGVLLHGDERVLDVDERLHHGFAVILQQLEIAPPLQVECALERPAVDERRRESGTEIAEQRAGSEQRPQRQALDAAAGREAQARQQRRPGRKHRGVARGERLFRRRNVGTSADRLQRQAGRDRRRDEGVEAAAADRQALGHAAGEESDRGLGLLQLLLERREHREFLVDDALLLGDLQRRHGADREPPLDGLEREPRVLQVLRGDLEPVLGREQREVGVGDARDGREHQRVAIEARRDRVIERRQAREPVASPKVELVARGQPERVAVRRDRPAPCGGTRRRAGRRGREVAAGRVARGRLRKQARARHRRLRIGLDDPGGRGGDVVVARGGEGRQAREFPRAEQLRPVRRQRPRGGGTCGVIEPARQRHVDGGPRLVERTRAERRGAKQERAERTHRTGRGPVVGRLSVRHYSRPRGDS